MATSTARERGKKSVTYGKPGRYTAVAAKFLDDTPSPERPRKKTGSVFATIEKSGALPSVRSMPNNNGARMTTPLDIFRVPDDDEHTPRASTVPPHRKIPPPPMTQDIDIFDFPDSDDEAPKQVRKLTTGLPLRNVERAQTKTSALKRKASERDTAPAARRRAKTPQVATKPKSVEQSQPEKRATRSRATTPAPMVAVSQKKAKETAMSNKKVMAKPATEIKSPLLNIFDIPSSDEDILAKPLLKPPPARVKKEPASPQTHAPPSPSPSVHSDVSNKSNRRKRQAPSVSSSDTTKATTTAGKKREASVPPRSRKYQKKENSISPGHDAIKVPLAPRVEVRSEPQVIAKSRRPRTQPIIPSIRIPILKGQSSPAKLRTMLVDRSKQKPTAPKQAEQPVPQEPPIEDETMYEPEDTVTPKAVVKKTVLGSVTPRQQTLFNHLLDDSSDSGTPVPRMSALKLTDRRRPGPAIPSLTKSSSDVPQSAHTRKGRLIDMLKQAASSSDESESDEETEEEIVEIPSVSAPTKAVIGHDSSQKASQDISDAMDVDMEAAVNSQGSQATVNLRTGGKITYAKQRSYLEEQGDNMEDLLDNMLDDNIGFGSQYQESISEEEDMMGLQGIHDLRNTGQQQKFYKEVESIIDDIEGQGGLNASQRRSAMMEFATQLANKDYAGQLLESSLTSRLLRSISGNSEIIFNFAAAVAMLFILEARPSAAILEEIHQSGIMSTLGELLSSKHASLDIFRISRERQVNMAPKARETVAEFRTLIMGFDIWPDDKPEKVSPQLLATKVLELLIVGMRQIGNSDALADEGMVTLIVDGACGPCQRLKSGRSAAQDRLLLNASFSALESLSVSKESQATWSDELLSRLADMMPAVFEMTDSVSPIRLAIRLCINLTNEKPSACKIFSNGSFVLSLLRSVIHNFKLLVAEVDAVRRVEVNEDLIFSLGAMINLAECSEQVRANAFGDGGDIVDEMVQIFLEGSERADQADSVEESQFIVPIGYLTILLGNLCLDGAVCRRVSSKLPGGTIDMLVQKVKEFISYNKRVDQVAGKFEGSEGQEVHRNFTERLGVIVERLAGARP